MDNDDKQVDCSDKLVLTFVNVDCSDKLVLTFVNVDVLPGYLVLLQILKEIRVVSENMDRTQNLLSGLNIPSLRKSSSCS